MWVLLFSHACHVRISCEKIIPHGQLEFVALFLSLHGYIHKLWIKKINIGYWNSRRGEASVLRRQTKVNPLSPKINIQILQTDLHLFLLRIVERIWFKIKAFSIW